MRLLTNTPPPPTHTPTIRVGPSLARKVLRLSMLSSRDLSPPAAAKGTNEEEAGVGNGGRILVPMVQTQALGMQFLVNMHRESRSQKSQFFFSGQQETGIEWHPL